MSLPEIVGKHCGALLWRRMQITLQPGSTIVDTELSQVNRSFGDQPPDDGRDYPSRVMVMPMAPLFNWRYVTHSEPYLLNGTVHIEFVNGNVGSTVVVDVLVWDPHSYVGPGGAHEYAVACTMPEADFVADPLLGNAPLTVQFTDLSTGNPHTWLWYFGDHSTSTEQNPVHTYVDGGDYMVQLTATNNCGSDVEIKMAYITVAWPS